MSLRFNYFALSIILFSFSVRAQNSKEFVKVTDLLRIKNAGSVTVCKDGTKAAFTVTSIEPDDKSTKDYNYKSQIFYLKLDDPYQPVQLTYSKEGASQPSWSPSGEQLAFTRVTEGKPQIFILSLKGGESFQLTKDKYGASNPKWSPDGKHILFSSVIPLRELMRDSMLNPGLGLPRWSYEKPGLKNSQLINENNKPQNPDGSIDEIRSYLDNNVKDAKAKVVTKLNFQDETGVNADMSFQHWFIADVNNPAHITQVTHGFYRYQAVSFTPDGKELIITANQDSMLHPDRALESSILLASLNGETMHEILGEKDRVYNNAEVSPSGKWLAFAYAPTGFVSIPSLAIMPLHGSVKDMVTIVFDRNKDNITWSEDEHYLYFTAPSNGGVPLFRVDIASRKIEQLTDNEAGISSFGISKNKLVFSMNQVSDPSEIYLKNTDDKQLVQLSNFNSWVLTRNLSKPVKYTFKNDKGMDIEYWVMKPANYIPGKKYPLILEMHGGPTAMWGPGEASMWHEFQYFCSKGYGVVYANPRGSGGYGENFLRANIKDWGTGPASDVLSALDKTVAEGWADPGHLYITGGSYAGYLCAWIIAHDHRFRAACAQRGVYDLATFFGEGNAWRLVPNYFGGYPWQPEVKKILDEESPITYVAGITTPFIIFHGENDRRTGFVQGEMMYRSLKVLNRPVEYVRHPGATHELTRSGDNRQRIDQMLRTYEFFERYK